MTIDQLSAILTRVKLKSYSFIPVDQMNDNCEHELVLYVDHNNVQDSTTTEYKLLDVRSQVVIEDSWTPEQVIMSAYRLACELAVHEIDETFKLDGELYKDPHPKVN